MDSFELKKLLQSQKNNNAILNILHNDQILSGLSFLDINSAMQDLDDDVKTSILKDNDFLTKHKAGSFDLSILLASYSFENLQKFYNANQDFFKDHHLHFFEMVNYMNPDSQKKLAENLNNMNLSFNEKNAVLFRIKPEIKETLDTSKLPSNYKTVFDIASESNSTKQVNVNFNRDLQDYKGLDYLINIHPDVADNDSRNKMIELSKVCPDLNAWSVLTPPVTYASTGKEFAKASEWIDSVINSLKPEYSNVQKLAIIDHAIGNKISYAPDFDSEIFSSNNNRSIWRIISNGHGVCNGISRIEQYMLKQVGIDSEIITGKEHAFLKIKNIELPLEDGTFAKGNTVMDPTWNMATHKFNARPQTFCLSYDEIRKHDIVDGIDGEYHKNDEKLQDANLELSVSELRNVFKSIGLTDKDGNFPVKTLCMQSNAVDEKCNGNIHENLKEQLELLENACPEINKFMKSCMFTLDTVLLQHPSFQNADISVNRVYKKEDKYKNPTLYVSYAEKPNEPYKFFVANTNENKFNELTEEEFDLNFEHYKADLEKQKLQEENREKSDNNLDEEK